MIAGGIDAQSEALSHDILQDDMSLPRTHFQDMAETFNGIQLARDVKPRPWPPARIPLIPETTPAQKPRL